MSSKQAVFTSEAPTPISLFSQAIIHSDTVYCSGMVGLDITTNTLVPGGVTNQADQLLRNLALVLKEAGSCLQNVLKLNVYITSMDDFAAMNEAYKRYFSAPLPARTCVAVKELPLGALVEMECTAFR